jgi:hypothetical protein
MALTYFYNLWERRLSYRTARAYLTCLEHRLLIQTQSQGYWTRLKAVAGRNDKYQGVPPPILRTPNGCERVGQHS